MDFPAAHSMDTDWYAVDRDGRVARCFSGEVGPVPDDAVRPTWNEVYCQLLVVRLVQGRDRSVDDPTEAALVSQIVDGDAAARAIYADHRESRGLGPAGWSPHARAIYTVAGEDLVLTALSAVPDYVAGIFVFASEDDLPSRWGWTEVDERYELPHARIGSLDRAAFDALWSAHAIAQVFLVDEAPEPHTLGLYEFHHDWGYDAYARDTVPAHPIILADLPEPLREQLALLRLQDVAFADAPSFDPEAHTACYRWGEG